MAAKLDNGYYVGTNGEAWLDTEKIMSLEKISAKVTGDFDEVKECGEFATNYVYMGWKGDGSLTVNKRESFSLKNVAEQYKTGDIKPIKIITKLSNKSTGKSERVAMWVIFKEFDLVNFEAKVIAKEEVPFMVCDFEPLETI